MRIGIDFDNTIANYDGVFHAAALELGLIDASLPTHKNAVRDFLNSAGRRDDFTALQGYVYGTRMELARPYPGFWPFVERAKQAGHALFVISHKTRYPLIGPRHDLHTAARGFLNAHKLAGPDAIPEANIFFEESKEEKIRRANRLAVDVFVDDLPEIFAMPTFPTGCRRILFAPSPTGMDAAFEFCRSWDAIAALLLGRQS